MCTSVEDYDWTKLTGKLNLVKDEYPDEEDANVILVPDNQIKAEVSTMDASRDDPSKSGSDGSVCCSRTSTLRRDVSGWSI